MEKECKAIKFPLCVRCGNGHDRCSCKKYKVSYRSIDQLSPGCIVQLQPEAAIFDTTIESAGKQTIMLSFGMVREVVECEGKYFITLYNNIIIVSDMDEFPYEILICLEGRGNVHTNKRHQYPER